MSDKAAFQPLSTWQAELGESPVWSAADRAVWWVDIDGGRLIRTALDGGEQVWETPEVPGFVQCTPGGVVVGMESGVFAFDPATGHFARRVAVDAPGQRFNDACAGADGLIWAGTMDLENKRDCGILFLLDPVAWTIEARAEGFRTINGLAWDSLRGRLYLSDSHPLVQTVWTSGGGADDLAGRSEFARFHDLPGRPDGAALDGQGNYWIAGVGGGEIYRFAPDGALTLRLPVPVEAPTKVLLLEGPERVMVMTSKRDADGGGHLHIWRDPPVISGA